jgi:UDP-GlcNAc:undecaprenyl-phosphate GlcNAc-1-phosphate transferase
VPIAAAFIAGLLVALAVTPLVRDFARDRGLLDEPGGRKIHDAPIPRLGGIAIVLATAAGVVVGAAVLASSGESVRLDRPAAFLAGMVVLVSIGIYDDVRGMPPLAKLIAQFAGAIGTVAIGLSIERFIGPWGTFELGPLAGPLTVVWIVGMLNAINLIDGLDGLASGVTLAALVAFTVIAALSSGETVPILAAAAGGGTLGFLRYNVSPASIHMGDTGSMFLGYVVAVLAIVVTQQGTRPAPPWAPLVALGVPVADTAWAILRRALRGRSILEADRLHIHHRLMAAGLSQRLTMLVLTGVGGLLGAIAVVLVLIA